MGTEITTTQHDTITDALTVFDHQTMDYLKRVGLPSEGILIPLDTRARIIQLAPTYLLPLHEQTLEKSAYLSKCLAAVASGLIDAALNYLWDETISELRKRIVRYDLAYFLDQSNLSNEVKKAILDNEDLSHIKDYDLIENAHSIGLLSDAGKEKLHLIRWMRNHASAAHPNETEIRASDLLNYIDVCVNEVINAEIPEATLSIARLLHNVRTQEVSAFDFPQQHFDSLFAKVPREKTSSLARALFSIYTEPDNAPRARANAKNVFSKAWGHLSNDVKSEFRIRTADFLTHLDTEKADRAKQLLLEVGGGEFIPLAEREKTLNKLLNQLHYAHHGIDNFFNEPPIAQEIKKHIGNSDVPEEIQFKYVEEVLSCFIGNQYGVSHQAEAIYLELLGGLNKIQADYAVSLLTSDEYSWLFRYTSPQAQRRQAAKLLLKLSLSPQSEELLTMLLKGEIPPSKFHLEERVVRLRTQLRDLY